MKKQIVGGIELRPQARSHDLVVSELPDEELVYDLKTHKAYCLNKTAAAVWKHCDGDTPVTGIAQALSLELGSEVKEELVWVALRQLSRSALLEHEIALPMDMGRVSRRQALRKIGLTGFALPLITSIIAPQAVQAMSCGDPDNNAMLNAVGCSCIGFNDCASNCCGFSAAPGHICVTPNSVLSGSPCRAGCECTSGTCSGSPLSCS